MLSRRMPKRPALTHIDRLLSVFVRYPAALIRAAIPLKLQKLDEMFDLETHGQRLLATESMSWLKGQGPLPVLPLFDEKSFALFANRYLETMWMVHRLVPLARPHTAPVPNEEL